MDAPVRVRPVARSLFLLPALLSSLLIAPPARADHTDGTYSGPITGGGNIQLVATGNDVDSVTATGMPSPCQSSATHTDNIPINTAATPHSFTHTTSHQGMRIQGEFIPGRVRGVIEVAGCPMPQQFDVPKVPGAPPPPAQQPCRCDDIKTQTENRRNIFSRDNRQIFDRRGPGPADDRVGVVTNFFRTTKTVFCKGVSPPDCVATAEIQVAAGDQDIAEVPKADRKAKCQTSGCPPQFQKTFEWRLRVWMAALKKKGVKKIHGRLKIICDVKTFFVPWIIALTPAGRVDKGSTDYGNPA